LKSLPQAGLKPLLPKRPTQNRFFPAGILPLMLIGVGWLITSSSVQADQTVQGLRVVYPPNNHQTTAERIFLIGTAESQTPVIINGVRLQQRSRAGHFSPSFPLQLGKNTFVLQAGGQQLAITVERLANQPNLPVGLSFGQDSLAPAVPIARPVNEPICFSAIAPPLSQVSVLLAGHRLPLKPVTAAKLPDNAAALTNSNQPMTATPGLFQGCHRFAKPGNLGQPKYRLSLDGKTLEQAAKGTVEVLNPDQLSSVVVNRPQGGVARTGPSSDHTRLTPLPMGTQAQVTAREGDWLRLDYGGWIRQPETQSIGQVVPGQTIIRSIRSRQVPGWTEVVFPLQVPVPVQVSQSDQTFTLKLYNTTAQTDVVGVQDETVIRRLDWQQVAPGQVDYRFSLKPLQQWGYKLRYDGTSLILSLRHPPQLRDPRLPLQGVTIVLDPGHGGSTDLGARGPTGLPEKQMTLLTSQLLQQALVQRGAKVVLTRTTDADLDLQPRVDLINQLEPTLALSVHYNALPDNGDAWNTQGVSMFWYQPQSHSLAAFLQRQVVTRLNRRSYGVFWNNLALARPTVAPAVLMELGFMINPQEYEWIVNPVAQRQLANTLAEGVTLWLQQSQSSTIPSP
jgi:N-acetylmuramoyl-L-alanine amidase